LRKFFQSKWHDIPFESFSKVSSAKVADETFYKKFYQVFFKKYQHPDDLDPEWVWLKHQVAAFIQEKIQDDENVKLLSIGCGLGLIELKLLEGGFKNLEITEISQDPLKWLGPHIYKGSLHLGMFPECVPPRRQYNLIYLVSVEYFFDQEHLISLLKDIKSHLFVSGKCLLISHSMEVSEINKYYHFLKDIYKFLLEKIGLRHRGQLWGYIRERREIRDAFRHAGFSEIADGVLKNQSNWNTYWIEGKY
jgi:hypothetical protein